MEGPDLEELIRLKYPAGEWAVVYELAKGTGWAGQDGRIDAAAFNCWPSKGFHRLAFEVKRSRGDFMRELERPAKREWVEKNFHQTWFVVPAGLIKPEEVPESWGLLVATKEGAELRKVKQAMHREIGAMPEALALSAIRALSEGLQREKDRKLRFNGDDITTEDLQRRAEEALEGQRLVLDGLVKRAKHHEDALEKERSALIEPLRVLAKAALGRHEAAKAMGGFSGDGPVTVTSEQVRTWIQEVTSLGGKDIAPTLKRARDALNELLGESPSHR
jgi:hypothetical protein